MLQCSLRVCGSDPEKFLEIISSFSGIHNLSYEKNEDLITSSFEIKGWEDFWAQLATLEPEESGASLIIKGEKVRIMIEIREGIFLMRKGLEVKDIWRFPYVDEDSFDMS